MAVDYHKVFSERLETAKTNLRSFRRRPRDPDRSQPQSSQERMTLLMNKSDLFRFARKLFTLVALVGCLLMLTPTQAKADWIDCLSDWQWCTFQCGSLTNPGWDQCADQCGQSLFICQSSSDPFDPFKIVLP